MSEIKIEISDRMDFSKPGTVLVKYPDGLSHEQLENAMAVLESEAGSDGVKFLFIQEGFELVHLNDMTLDQMGLMRKPK